MGTVKDKDIAEVQNCNFAVDFNTIKFKQEENGEESNMSEPFIILEHIKKDSEEYRNGMITFKLNKNKIADMALSFENKSVGRDLFVNYDHNDGIAAGWFKNVYADGNKLMASIEWTDKAKEHIKNKEYRYFSAEAKIAGMVAKFEGEKKAFYDPKFTQSILTGGALTNDPFFKTTEVKLSNDKGDINMDDFSKLNADYEQLNLDFKAKNEENLRLSAEVETLKAEIIKFKNETRDQIVNEALKELPDTKHEEVQAKLLKFSEKYDSMAEFKEFAIAFAKSQDTRVKSPEAPADLKLKTIQEKQPVSVATFAEEQAELMKKYLQRGE